MNGLQALSVRQYTYFAIGSDTLTPAEIEEQIGLAPDEFTVRGSRQQAPPVPVSNIWKRMCAEPGAIDEQAHLVLNGIRSAADRIRTLVEQTDAECWLQYVRYFGDEEGVTGQLGWHLDAADLALLVHMHASIDSDEYG